MTEKLLKIIEHGLQEMQAIDVVELDVREKTTVTDYMFVATGRSARHVKSIAQYLTEAVKKEQLLVVGSVGLELGEWALLDFGDVVVHILQPDSRIFYNIEGLWGEKA